MRLTAWQYCLALALVSFLIRLAVVVLLRDITLPPQGADSQDDVEFHHMGQRLANGQGYVGDQGKPTSFRAPGYPFFLAAVYATVGEHAAAIYVLHCLLGALSCVLTYALARELLSENLARVAGVLACFYLGPIYFAANFLSENVFVPCLALGAWATVRYLKGGPLWLLGVAGLLLGYATLTRPLALLLLGLLPPLFAVHEWRRGRWPVAAWALYGLTFLAVVLPWTYRNYQAHGQFVLMTTNGGSTFYGSNNDRVVSEWKGLGYWFSTTELPHRDLIEATPDEVSHDKMEWKLGLDWVRANPGKAALSVVLKFLRMWWLPDFEGHSRYYYALRIVAYAPYVILMLLGAVTIFRDRSYWTLPWLAIHVAMLATVLTVLLFGGLTRFRDANLALLMIYSAVGFGRLPLRRAGSVSLARGGRKPPEAAATH
jgi:4-amino-4-deoxy-L-arabinose transferase-like glycosyltransferase